jgi:hypothetical protein
VKIDVYGIQAGQEINKSFFLGCRHEFEKSVGNGSARREGGIDTDIELESFSIYISDVYTTLVGKKNRVTLSGGINANVVFGIGWMWEERLDDEVVQGPDYSLNLVIFG